MRFLFLITLTCVIQSVCVSATITVPGDYATIQGAINIASNNDVIVVGPATYYENIDFLGKAIEVRSSDGPADTIIDGGQNDSVVKFQTAEGAASILDGFTITNGSGHVAGSWAYGGGIYCQKSAPTIQNNIITNNSVLSASDGYGGGVYFYSHSYYYTLTLTNNIITNNDADQGGGVYNYSGDMEITNNTIADNYAPDGGGLRLRSASTDIVNCIVWDNTASHISLAGLSLQGGSVFATYSDIQEGDGQSWFGTGCIESDPDFAGSGNYHLTSSSPCIDTGDNTAANLLATDFEGDARIMDGDSTPGAVVDMGADEVDSPTLITLVSFHTKTVGNKAWIHWETASEMHNAGFHLWRCGIRGKFHRITKLLIPAKGGPTWGANYRFVDPSAKPGRTYSYILEDVDYSGKSAFHRPITVTL